MSVNKPFKDNVRKLNAEWMAAGQHDLTLSGKIRRPSVCSWIVDAWSGISNEVVAKVFEKTGISKALDGTEEDFLWDCEHASSDDTAGSDNEYCGDNSETLTKVTGPY